jgi:hypothetical protein
MLDRIPFIWTGRGGQMVPALSPHTADADPLDRAVRPSLALNPASRRTQRAEPPRHDHTPPELTDEEELPAETPTTDASAPDGAAGSGAWIWPWVWPLAYLPFRLLVTVAAILLFDQAVFAGQFLSGTFGALEIHHQNAIHAAYAVLGAGLAAVPIRWPARGPVWPVFACLGLFGLIALQIRLGFLRELTVHVPLGVSIIVLALLLLIWGWRPHCGPAGPSTSGATGDVR